ncbi:diguanylate cyclase/phosphodiesterase (GGDEF & EAL domains) with PAS/PAC sensor(s) [hydrothermal vent metagenome]|uniref:Diguanylate cyclase/phosphodiesterase (GGDEF & EAL domains) with PAS/PAC sensor(S) n=2 Tax=hydrothermal vent metagenome TaxID=652676 RepID=A0A3B1BI98_9ZZZZ
MTYIKKDSRASIRNASHSSHSISPTLLYIAFSSLIFLCMGIGFVSINQSNQAHHDLEAVIDKIGIKLELLKTLHTAARERSINLYIMVSEPDPFERDDAFMRYNQNATDFSVAYNKIIAMPLSTEEQRILEQQTEATNYTVHIQREVVQLTSEGKLKEARELMTGKTINAQNKVVEYIAQLQLMQYKSITEIEALADESNLQAKNILYILVSLALILGSSIAIYTTRRIKRIEKSITKEKELALVTLQSVGDAVITTDNQGYIQFMNPVAEHLTGYNSEQAIYQSLEDVFTIISESDHLEAENPVSIALNEHIIFSKTDDIVLIRKDGKEFAIELTAAPIMDDEHEIFGAILTFHDVSEMRSMSYKISYQATHDSLTGLVNRHEFEVRLEQTIQNARNEKTSHALCYLDLDQFKVVNDSAGHAAGDELLKQLAQKLQPLLRKSDVLARLGGDEFGVLLEGCSEQQAYKIANIMRTTIKETRFPWGNNTFEVGVSIGLVPINSESSGVSDILSAADTACYAAKENGRNQVQTYRENDKEFSKRKTEMRWVQDIQHALATDSFLLYCQKIIPIDTNSKHKRFCELLIRLQTIEGEIIPPMAFLPAAERYNLITDIDKWVIHNALITLQEYQNDNLDEKLFVAINLSGQSLSDSSFLEYTRNEILNSHCSPEHLCFEVTETAAIANMSKAIHFINSLKELGCKFALDDFGNGLSSFAYLKNMPVDFLKIDGSFVRDICHDKMNKTFVETIHRIGTMMGIETIAEYVENEETLNMLKEIGVHYAQGMHIDKPKNIDEVRKNNSLAS